MSSSSSINLKKCNPEAHSSESINALTFEELQNTLSKNAKDFGSMPMDELLKNIWGSEERQIMVPNYNSSVINNTYMQKQGFLSFPITRKEDGGFKDVDLIKEPNLQEKQPSLDELTLEQFLRKAGVVLENGQKHPNQNNGFHQLEVVTNSKTEVNNFQGVGSSQQPKPQKILPKIAPKQGAFNFTSSLSLVKKAQMGSGVNEVSTIGKCDYPTKSNFSSRSESNLFPNSNLDTPPSPPTYGYGEGGVCGRNTYGSLEKVVERRRKRMIKNRESASRSRARKQVNFFNLHHVATRFTFIPDSPSLLLITYSQVTITAFFN